MKLNNRDYQYITTELESCGSVEYHKGNEVLSFDYKVEVNGYREDDYNNGTGAFIATSVEVIITNVACYNEDGEDVECNFDEYLLERTYAKVA